ncbi:MAG: glucose-1-phosphate adenylyltransferase [Planctomycetaceae bacterium]|nr:glucose-1-phosphate adenylyltransferase [Planctomycetaceae bacterium]
MNNVACFILGGGKGTRLLPLTADRSKPAVPLGGKYRLIDIPISNCINSSIRRIYLLTQFNSVSLHRHIRQTYNFDPYSGGFVEILAAQQTNEGANWYQGTADAVRKQLRYLQQPGIDYVLILSGDQLYRMNFEKMLETHLESNAQATIAALPVSEDKAKSFGIMRLTDTGRVEGFLEKPETVKEMKDFYVDAEWIENRGIPCNDRHYLASMGIYLFDRKVLVDALEKTTYQDFGKEVFPALIRSKRVHVDLFDGYWEDIGTIKAFYECNLEMASPTPPFALDDSKAVIFTRPRFLPPTRIDGAKVSGSLISDGCVLEPDVVVDGSLIGLRSVLGRGSTVRRSVVMGSDFYQTDDRAKTGDPNDPPLGIGEGSVIEGAIVDKNCRIGRNVVVKPPGNSLPDGKCGPVIVRDGVIVIPRGTILPNDWKMDRIEPCDF